MEKISSKNPIHWPIELINVILMLWIRVAPFDYYYAGIKLY